MRLKDYILNSLRTFPNIDSDGNIILSRFYEEEESKLYGFTGLGLSLTDSSMSTVTVKVADWTISSGSTSNSTNPVIDYNNKTIYFQTDNQTTGNDTEI